MDTAAIVEYSLGGAFFLMCILGYFFLFRRYCSSEPNEWMIVMRNGKLIECGVGISYYAGLEDVVVKFPSKINKVRFAAQQVTQEMQGIEVSGIIIWSIYREKDGPLKAFKYLGKDLTSDTPTTANEQMVEISNAIVRHRIANSTIDEVLKNREMVRDEIKKEMNEIVNGWGIWLESVEITDVKILSSTLFGDLQMEFRKEQQQKAEYIKMETERDLKERRLKTEIEYTKKEAENESQKTIYKSSEDLKIAREKQRVFEEQQKIERKKVETDSQAKQFKEKNDNEFRLFEKEQSLIVYLKNSDQLLNKKKKEESIVLAERKLKKFNNENWKITENLNKNQQLETEKKENQLKDELLLKKNPKIRVLEAVMAVYKVLPIHEMKIFNYGENRDPVAGLMSQVFGAVKNLSGQSKA